MGINGFLCKCSHYYCKKHRLPEEHDCKFDHAAQARKLLIENNPLIEGAKIDKIWLENIKISINQIII